MSKIMSPQPFHGTITLRKSVGGPRLVAWREKHRRKKVYQKGWVPPVLAMYLPLVCKGFEYTNKVYDFSNKELDKLTADGEIIKRVTRKKKGDVILTVEVDP